MKIAVFYENLLAGAEKSGVCMEEVLVRLKQAGMQMIYVSDRTLAMQKEWLLPLLSKLGLQVEGVYGFCDFAGNPANEEYKQIIECAAKTGASNILIVPGGSDPKDGRQISNIKTGIKKAVNFGQSMGIRVSMEDFDGLNVPYCTIDGLARFIEEIPDLWCSFDTGNFVMYQEDERLAFKRFLSRICTVHAKDRSHHAVYPNDKPKTCADGSDVYPCPVGYGYIHMEEIIGELLASGYDGNIIAELFDCDEDHLLEAAEKSVKWLKQMIDKKVSE